MWVGFWLEAERKIMKEISNKDQLTERNLLCSIVLDTLKEPLRLRDQHTFIKRLLKFKQLF